MAWVQAHRGPDDAGVWDQRFPDGTYMGLGSRRLAIIDPSSSGHMPMHNVDRTLWITYNGEIYNFAELRERLKKKGHRFFSNTDTEVLLRLYEEEGADCVRRLKGMFAFAICDLRSGEPTMFLARDHFGVKPLYYFHCGDRFAFASEIKALLQVPDVSPEIDVRALHQYLTFLWVPDPGTIFRGVYKLPAGHSATFRAGRLTISKYWDLAFPPADHEYLWSEKDLASETRARFEASVQSQLVSDVPVGAFLSAGLDSSSIVAMMARHAHRPLRTYTITFPEKYLVGENTLDDPGVPARLAKDLGFENEIIVVEPNVAELLPRLVWHMDEPTADPAILAAYVVCRQAREHATVLLSGVGGDELFAGYRKYAAHYWAELYRRFPSTLRHFTESGLGNLREPRGSSLKGSIRLAKKMSRSASLPGVDRFVMNCTYLDGPQKKSLYRTEWAAQIEEYDPLAQHRDSFKRVEDADFLNQMLYVDTKIFMTSLNLTYNDKMSMASSVEIRVPFLDRELVEFVAWNVPPHLKLKGFINPTTKHIFRQAMRDVLPSEVLRQPKAGFAAPVDYWLANDLREMVDDLLAPSRIRDRGIFRPEVVREYVDEHRVGKRDWSMQIWQFLTLELWCQVFLDKETKRTAPNYSALPQAANA
jgi:asparagine synthase (glutamine-hydrolysing)